MGTDGVSVHSAGRDRGDAAACRILLSPVIQLVRNLFRCRVRLPLAPAPVLSRTCPTVREAAGSAPHPEQEGVSGGKRVRREESLHNAGMAFP